MVVYYVVTNIHFENEKTFISNFQSRLPKVSKQVNTESPENVNAEYSDPSENPEHSLVNTMKNIFNRQEHEIKEGLSKEYKEEAVTMNKDKELEARLLDSAEIVLFTNKPSIYENPKLKLDLPKLNTMV